MNDDDFVLEALVEAIKPDFQAAILELPMSDASSQGPPRAAAGFPGRSVGLALIGHLAGPVLKLAASLILRHLQQEAQIVLDAEKAAHPGLSLAGLQQFVDALGPATGKAGG